MWTEPLTCGTVYQRPRCAGFREKLIPIEGKPGFYHPNKEHALRARIQGLRGQAVDSNFKLSASNGISVADQLLLLQYSIYSVISPEGCASILWKTSDRASDAADALGITAHRLKALGLVDKIVNEPVGGAHRDTKLMASQLKRGLNDAWRQVSDLKVKELLDKRYERLQSYGRFTDTKADAR